MTGSHLPLTETLDSCPLCGGREFSRRYKPDVCRCSTCRVYFRNPRPDESAVVQAYSAGATFRQWQHELDIRAHLWKKRCALIARHRRSGSLLDVGTGDGYFLDFVKADYDVEATEICESGAAYARKRGHPVHCGTIFDAAFDTKTFNIITMWHVLEHVAEPGKTIQRVKSLLEPDGLLFVAVPNEIAPLCRAEWKGTHPFEVLTHGREIHLSHFTPGVLTGVLKNRFGFDIIEFGVDDVHVFQRRRQLPRYFASRLCSRLFGWHWDKAMTFVCTPTQRDSPVANA